MECARTHVRVSCVNGSVPSLCILIYMFVYILSLHTCIYIYKCVESNVCAILRDWISQVVFHVPDHDLTQHCTVVAGVQRGRSIAEIQGLLSGCWSPIGRHWQWGLPSINCEWMKYTEMIVANVWCARAYACMRELTRMYARFCKIHGTLKIYKI